MNHFIQGAVSMGCAVIATFFLRFWRRTGDRLFVFFSAAFWLMGFDWLALAYADVDEPHTAIYLLRLLAFVVILIGIVDKNRSLRRRSG